MDSGKEDGLVVEGTVTESLRNKFRVEIDSDDPSKPHSVLAHLAGKMRKNFIRIVVGDRVKVELSPYDLTQGRIIFRMK